MAVNGGVIRARLPASEFAEHNPNSRLRNRAGQFRSSRVNNPAVKEGGDIATQRAAGRAAEAVVCRE